MNFSPLSADQIKTICGYCRRFLYGNELSPFVSHGACKECAERELNNFRAAKQAQVSSMILALNK